MLSQLKALAVVLALSSLSFWLARRAIPRSAIDDDAFKTYRNTWLLLSACAFLAGNFMLFLLVASVILIRIRNHGLRAAQFLALCLVMPAFQIAISGLGPINNLVTAHYLRLLSWLILIPAWWAIVGNAKHPAPRTGAYLTDWMFILAGVLQAVLQLPIDTFTNTLRTGFYYFSDIYLPYWVMSRAVTNVAQLRHVAAALSLGVMAVSLTAVFEFFRRWPVYDGLDNALGVFMPTVYLIRGETGWMRATASAGHSLALGYVCAMALLLFWAFKPQSASGKPALDTRWWRAGMALLTAALFASLARGSWIGAVAGLLVWKLTDKTPVKSLLKAAMAGALTLGLLSLTPQGETAINAIPFIGQAEQSNVEYRERLLNISWLVLWENPWLGSYDYMSHPLMLQLIQGQGIVDMVNTYLGYGLSSGLVGLTMFVASFLLPMAGLTRQLWSRAQPHEATNLARALLATMVATLLIIATTSSVHVIPWMYWSLIGLCVSCTRLMKTT